MKIDMADLLKLSVDEGVSDLHLEVGLPPMVRLHGKLRALDTPKLTPEQTEKLVNSITSDEHKQAIREIGTIDFGFAFGDKARFRVSAFKQKGKFGMVLRQIPKTILTLDQIGLPPSIKDLLFRPRGLVLVTGPTGSGKSTTLASMLDIINKERECHIITIEDPIEFYHDHKKSIVIQREVGSDVPTFSEALKRALRQDPDVILVGEMRDLETMQAAVTAAETGHLVFGTLHTTGAARTVDRIVDSFPSSQQLQIRTQLASTLLAVISQELMPRIDVEGLVAGFEIMTSTASVKAMIRDNKSYMLTSEIQTGARWGMNTLDDHLFKLYTNKIISYTSLITKSQDPDSLNKKLESEK